MEEGTSENRFKCHIYMKTFTTKQILERHERTHTGEKPFCDFCNKTFAEKGTLNEHILVKNHMNVIFVD